MSQSFIVTDNFGMSFTGMAPLKSFYPYKFTVNVENYTKIAKLIVCFFYKIQVSESEIFTPLDRKNPTGLIM